METNEHVDLVAEAEKIIAEHIAKTHQPAADSIHAYLAEPINWGCKSKYAEKPKPKLRFDFMIYLLMFAACIALAAIVTFGLLGRG